MKLNSTGAAILRTLPRLHVSVRKICPLSEKRFVSLPSSRLLFRGELSAFDYVAAVKY